MLQDTTTPRTILAGTMNGFPHLESDVPGVYFRWELFKNVPHDGWVLLCWKEHSPDDVECVKDYMFGNDLEAALAKFIAVHKLPPQKEGVA